MKTAKDIKKVLVVFKKTKYELDSERYSNPDFLLKIYKIQNDCHDKVFQSHERQTQSREFIRKEVFPNGEFIFRDDLDRINLSNFELIVSHGGDNHFTYVAHYSLNHLILGCNSDSRTSVGALLSFEPEALLHCVKNGWNGSRIEEWTLISVSIEYPNGETVETVQGVSEISIRNNSPDLTSRYIIHHMNKIEEQKSSGLLLYTGAGSTGWYASCAQKGNPPPSFSKTEPYFRVYSRELGAREQDRYKLTDFKVENKFVVVSEMNGGISVDSLPENIYDFPAGARATFKVSAKKLNVITNYDK
ncbi:MAG: NAD+ kinase [Leptospira sp.]|nr:NAD+ kinase [Leptospira sp.]